MSDLGPHSEDNSASRLQEDTTSCSTEDNQEAASTGSANGVATEPKPETASGAASSKKIPLCRFFKKAGKCRYGDGCRFAHELPSKLPREEESGGETGQGTDELKAQSETSSQEKSSGDGEKVCRFYSRSGWCRNGKRCRFLHQKMKAEIPAKDAAKEEGTTAESQEGAAAGSGDAKKEEMASSLKPQDGKRRRERPGKICRYFKAGHCSMEDRCRFIHPKVEESDVVTPSDHAKPVRSSEPRTAMARPNVIQSQPVSMKIADLGEEDVKKLRETEITQLMKRFTEDQMTVVEKEDGDTVYRVTVNPTDPDWPYDIQDFELEVVFPDGYPLDPFSVSMPEDQVLPNTVLQYMTDNIGEWILARHGTNQISGKVELMFRPFLRWLDRSLERLFTEAAKQFKKMVDAKVAGFEFVAYSQQKPGQTEDVKEEIPTLGKNEKPDQTDNTKQEMLNPDQKEDTECDTDSQQPDSSTDLEGVVTTQGSSTPHDPDKASDAPPADSLSGEMPPGETPNKKVDLSNVQRRGTEVKLCELEISESVSTLVAQTIGVIIQCSRCKNRCDIITPPKRLNSARCGKCQHQQLVTFRQSLVHHFAATMGFLDLEGCTTFDLILAECVFAIGCLNCSEETKVQGLQFGQTRTLWCEKCHTKMTVQVGTAKFHKLQASQLQTSDKAHIVQVKQMRKQVHPDIHEGHPLPHNGTCKHYKKSFRWLRFPCCGKCYPCDLCHDEAETDHEMKYATRMVCGFCCKEQQYTPDKPCVSCQSLTTKPKTSHWEGGMGCRNKNKMSKSDKQKYSNTNKTVSRKQQNLQVDKKAK